LKPLTSHLLLVDNTEQKIGHFEEEVLTLLTLSPQVGLTSHRHTFLPHSQEVSPTNSNQAQTFASCQKKRKRLIIHLLISQEQIKICTSPVILFGKLPQQPL